MPMQLIKASHWLPLIFFFSLVFVCFLNYFCGMAPNRTYAPPATLTQYTQPCAFLSHLKDNLAVFISIAIDSSA